MTGRQLWSQEEAQRRIERLEDVVATLIVVVLVLVLTMFVHLLFPAFNGILR